MVSKLRRFYPVLSALGALTMIIACAGTPKTVDPLQQYAPLVRAGFELRDADTPQKQAVINNLPKQVVVPYTINKKLHYVYVPEGCQCAYVGTEENYQLLRRNIPENQPVQEVKIGFSSDIFFYSPGIGNDSFLSMY